MTVHVEAWIGPVPAVFVRFGGTSGLATIRDAMELRDQLGQAIAAMRNEATHVAPAVESGMIVGPTEVIW